jgi:aspartate-semialdehyde dehydrogenase
MSNAQRSFHVAVVGATGAVGETMLSILAERDFPVGTLSVLASERSAGGEIEFNGQKVTVQDLATSIRAASRSRCSRPVAACPRNTRRSSPLPVRW